MNEQDKSCSEQKRSDDVMTNGRSDAGMSGAPQGYFVPFQPSEAEDEIDLLEIWKVMRKEQKLILGVATAVTIIAILMALLMTPIYRGQVEMIAVNDEEGGGASGLAQYAGLASMAGINLGGGGSEKDEAIAILKSRAFTERFINDEKLLPILFDDKWDAQAGKWDVDEPEEIPSMWQAYDYFNKDIRQVNEDQKTGLVTLTIDWKNRKLAAQWANQLVQRVNQYLRERAIREAQKSITYLKQELAKTSVVEVQQGVYRLIEAQVNKIMLANVRDEYAFRVIDPAVIPDKYARIKPKRKLIVVLGGFLGLFLGVLLAFIHNYIRKQKERLAAEAR